MLECDVKLVLDVDVIPVGMSVASDIGLREGPKLGYAGGVSHRLQ